MTKLSHFITQTIPGFAKRYPLSLLCIAIVWYLSLFVNMPETPLDDVPLIDKWTHLVMYGDTCSVIWWEYLRNHNGKINASRLFWLAWLAPVAMSGLIELLQAYCTTTRCGEWLDFCANTLGCTLGAVVGLAMKSCYSFVHSR